MGVTSSVADIDLIPACGLSACLLIYDRDGQSPRCPRRWRGVLARRCWCRGPGGGRLRLLLLWWRRRRGRRARRRRSGWPWLGDDPFLRRNLFLGRWWRCRGQLDEHGVGAQLRRSVAHGHELDFFGGRLVAGERKRGAEGLVCRHGQRAGGAASLSRRRLYFRSGRLRFKIDGVLRCLE